MSPTKERYERIEDKAKRGEYTLVEPLDYVLLGELPDEGELVMGLYPLAKSVDQLRKEKFSMLSPGSMGGQLRSLMLQGLVVSVKTRGPASHAYQRTEAGKKLHREWKAAQKAPDKSGGNSGGENK